MHQLPLLKSTVHDSILAQLMQADPLTDTSFVEMDITTNCDQATELMLSKVTD